MSGNMSMSTWGFGKWGSSLYWGYEIVGVLARSQCLNATIAKMLSQNPATNLEMSAKITADGVDISSSCTAGTISLRADGTFSTAEFGIKTSTAGAITLHSTEIIITIVYTFPDGTTMEQPRFRGIAHKLDKEQTLESDTYRCTAFCLGHKMTLSPMVSKRVFSGTDVIDIINAELAAIGLTSGTGSWVNYQTLGAWYRAPWGSSWDAVWAMANGRRVSSVFVDPSGVVRISDWEAYPSTLWSWTLAAQTEQEIQENTTNRYNRVVWTNGYKTYNDATDQATYGILPVEHQGTRLLNRALAPARSADFCNASQKPRMRVRTPLNAFLFPGESITCVLKDSRSATLRIEGCTDSFGWPGGFWTDWDTRVNTVSGVLI